MLDGNRQEIISEFAAEEYRIRLHTLVQNNDYNRCLNLIKRCRERAIELEEKDIFGYTVLHWAAYANNTEIILALISEKKTLIDPLDEVGRTPLKIAVEKDNFESVKLLIKLGADPLIPDESGENSFYTAIKKMNKKTICTMVKVCKDRVKSDYIFPNKATITHTLAFMNLSNAPYNFVNSVDIYAPDNIGNSIIHNCCTSDNYLMLEYLISQVENLDQSRPNNEGLIPIQIAYKHGSKYAAEILLQNEANMNVLTFNDESLAMLACKADKNEEYLLNLIQFKGIEKPDINGKTSLYFCISYGKVELIAKILAKNSFTHSISYDQERNWSYIHQTTNTLPDNKFLEVVTLLKNSGHEVDEICDDVTPLMIAAENRQFYKAGCLVDLGADINKTNSSKESALSLCIKRGFVDMLSLISKNKENIDHINYKNETALFYALDSNPINSIMISITQGNREIIENIFMQNKVILSSRDCKDMNTFALNKIGLFGVNFGKVAYLNDYSGPKSPHITTMVEYEIINFLIFHTKKINHRNNDGNTVLHKSVLNKMSYPISLLIENSIDTSIRNNAGKTALELAYEIGFTEGQEILNKHKTEKSWLKP